MSFPPEYGRLKFGERLLFNDDGAITSASADKDKTVTIGPAESPLQLRRPQPIGEFDKEPVKIPLGHPLAASTPMPEKKEPKDEETMVKIQTQRCYMRVLMDQLEKLTAVNNEIAKNGEQTAVARKVVNDDRIQRAEEDLNDVEKRIESEKKETQEFMKLCNKKLEQCTLTSKAVSALSNKVDNVEQFKESHEKAGHTMRMNFNFMQEIDDTVKYCDRLTTQMKEAQSMSEMKEKEDYLELSLSLLAVQDSLKTINGLAPIMFRTAFNPLGQMLQNTVDLIWRVVNMVVEQLPNELREAVNTASTTTSLLSSSSPSCYSQKTSEVSTDSTQPSRHIRVDSWPSASLLSAAISTDASTYHPVHSPLNLTGSDELLAAGAASSESLVSISE